MRDVDFDKYAAVSALLPGDIVKLTTGEMAEFIKMKQKKFNGIIEGKLYNIPINMFGSVIKKAEKNEGFKELKKNEPFYINDKGKALLFTFEKMEGDYIIGLNPVSKGNAKIPIAMYAGKVGDL